MGQVKRTNPTEDVANASENLLTRLAALPPTTEAAELIEKLAATERGLATAYERLAAAHERAGIRDLLKGALDGSEAGPAQWIDSVVAFRTASTLARAAATALERARHDEAIARWFDDIGDDFRHG